VYKYVCVCVCAPRRRPCAGGARREMCSENRFVRRSVFRRFYPFFYISSPPNINVYTIERVFQNTGLLRFRRFSDTCVNTCRHDVLDAVSKRNRGTNNGFNFERLTLLPPPPRNRPIRIGRMRNNRGRDRVGHHRSLRINRRHGFNTCRRRVRFKTDVFKTEKRDPVRVTFPAEKGGICISLLSCVLQRKHYITARSIPRINYGTL